MAAATGLASIEKLTEENYELWKVQMKSVLVYNDLWQYTDGTIEKPGQGTADQVQVWVKKDSKALALINLSVSHSQLSHIKKATTSSEAWNGLKTVFESRGPVRKAALYKQLLRMEKEPDIAITQYVSKFTNKAEQLEEAGIKIPDELLSIMLLSSLPTEFENFCIAIESQDNLPTLENLKIKIIEEEARQNERAIKKDANENMSEAFFVRGTRESSKQSSMNQNNFRFNGKCFSCGKIGHKSQFRRSKERNESNQVSDALTVIACNVEHIEKSNAWYLDSGATRHMCNNAQNFENLMSNEKLRVYTAAESFVESKSIGTVALNIQLENDISKKVELKDTLYVPDLRNNLLSVSCVTNNDYSVTFHKNHATINRQDGSIVLKAFKQGQLYIVNETKENAFNVCEQKNLDVIKWHQRYGHINLNDLKKMVNEKMVSGINFEPKVCNLECEVCAKCKIHVLPFSKSENREKEVLALIHSDICGPMNVESLGGGEIFRYVY